jgi:hypothetical protein
MMPMNLIQAVSPVHAQAEATIAGVANRDA